MKTLLVLTAGLAVGGVIGWIIGVLRIPIEKPDRDYLEQMTAHLFPPG